MFWAIFILQGVKYHSLLNSNEDVDTAISMVKRLNSVETGYITHGRQYVVLISICICIYIIHGRQYVVLISICICIYIIQGRQYVVLISICIWRDACICSQGGPTVLVSGRKLYLFNAVEDWFAFSRYGLFTTAENRGWLPLLHLFTILNGYLFSILKR